MSDKDERPKPPPGMGKFTKALRTVLKVPKADLDAAVRREKEQRESGKKPKGDTSKGTS